MATTRSAAEPTTPESATPAFSTPGLLTLGLAILELAACAAPADPAAVDDASSRIHPRRALFATVTPDPMTETLALPARLTALFHPEVARCTPHEMAVARALGRVDETLDDVRVLTVLPRSRARLAAVYGEPLPGETLVVADASWIAEGELSPRPRLELWSGDGRLLMIKSIPSAATEEAIYEDVLWARSFTAPLD